MNFRTALICAAMGWTGLLLCDEVSAQGFENVTDEDLPTEALQVLKEHDTESDDIRRNAEKEISVHRETAIKLLDDLQNKYNDEQQSDTAIAIRDKIRELRIAHLKPQPNPGTLSRLGNKIGQTFYFDVTGDTNGTVWGTDVYTIDSTLAAAVVHAGVLKAGQRGTVRVTIIKTPYLHKGSTRNDVTTREWGPFTASYKIRRPLSSDKNVDEPATEPAKRANSPDVK